jgi:hypothetical protein
VRLWLRPVVREWPWTEVKTLEGQRQKIGMHCAMDETKLPAPVRCCVDVDGEPGWELLRFIDILCRVKATRLICARL